MGMSTPMFLMFVGPSPIAISYHQSWIVGYDYPLTCKEDLGTYFAIGNINLAATIGISPNIHLPVCCFKSKVASCYPTFLNFGAISNCKSITCVFYFFFEFINRGKVRWYKREIAIDIPRQNAIKFNCSCVEKKQTFSKCCNMISQELLISESW